MTERIYTGFLATVSGFGTVGAWIAAHGLSTACGIAGLVASIELIRYTRLRRKKLEREMYEEEKP